MSSCSTASFGAKEMLQILRDEDSGICMTGSFQSNGSQVSVLPPSGSQAYHLLTATPDPSVSVFKPFIFCAGAATGDKTLSEVRALAHDVVNIRFSSAVSMLFR